MIANISLNRCGASAHEHPWLHVKEQVSPHRRNNDETLEKDLQHTATAGAMTPV